MAESDVNRTHQEFTAKERDNESGLDYFLARYYSGPQGRFTSPDPGPYIKEDPQTWNRFSYTRNNPLKYIDPSGRYFVVSANYAAAKQYISMMLRSQSGRALVQGIAFDSKPTNVSAGRLPITPNSNGGLNITNGTTTPIPGKTPGPIAGTNVVLDPVNAALTSAYTNQTNVFGTQLKAATHEFFHVQDINQTRNLQEAAAAGAAGDAPTRQGGTDTLGGTAERRALGVMSELGGLPNSYTPDAAADSAADAIIEFGAKRAAIEPPKVEPMPIPKKLEEPQQ